MRISDWSSDVCSSDLSGLLYGDRFGGFRNTIPNPDNISSTDGIPALSVVDDYRFAVFTEGGLPYFDSGAAGLLGVDGPGVSLPGFGIAPNGNYIFDAQGRPLQFGDRKSTRLNSSH